ncbi:MAG: hypothetical protein HRU23_00895 [Gammaproteobacteria bacterium]|nr:hypothetical protein [Gammaproteobacteria bacterium]
MFKITKIDTKASCSEPLDPLLKSIVDTNSIVTQAYLNTNDDMNRTYSFITDVPSQFGPDIVLKDNNFCYFADQNHNPERNTVWTKAYLNPAGLGWMVSAISPIYYNDQLEAVAWLVVTISILVNDNFDY